MDTDGWLLLLLFALMVLCASYFASTETAYASVNRIRIKNRADNGEPKAKKAEYILENFEKALTTILIGSNIMHIGCSAIATLLVTRVWGVGSVAYSTAAVTVILFLLGEAIPKRYASSHPASLSVSSSSALCLLMKVLSPVSWLFTSISEFFAKLVRGKAQPTVNEEELYEIIENIGDGGDLDTGESELIQSALELDNTNLKEILTPRSEITGLDAEAGEAEVLAAIKGCHFSRLPVYEGTIDRIIGILSIRKYMKEYLKTGHAELRSLLDRALCLPMSERADDALREMSSKRLHMAVVLDEFGGTLGIVTVEDILEELVGEIWDEDDVVNERFYPLGGNRYRISSTFPLSEAMGKLGSPMPETTSSDATVGGWVLEQFPAFPSEGDRFNWGEYSVTVERMNRRKILTLLFQRNGEGGDAR